MTTWVHFLVTCTRASQLYRTVSGYTCRCTTLRLYWMVCYEKTGITETNSVRLDPECIIITYSHTHTHTHTDAYMHKYSYRPLCIHTYLNRHTYTQAHNPPTHTPTDRHPCYTYTQHIRMHTFTHTHTHTSRVLYPERVLSS